MKRLLWLIPVICVLLSGCSSGDKRNSEIPPAEQEVKKDERYLYDENGGICGVNTEALDYSAGNGVAWSYDEETKTLSFSGKGTISYAENYEPYSLYAERIVIGDGITALVNSAFEDFGLVTEVAMADTVKAIESRAFYNCSEMKSINLPAELEYMGKEAFASCVNLSEITFPKNDAFYEIKSDAFNGCVSLTMAVIPPTVTYIEPSAFNGCTGLSIYCEEDSFAYNYAKTENILITTYAFD